MPAALSPSLSERAAEILAAISDFESCLYDVTPGALAKEEFRRLALERAYRIICGAVRHLPTNLKAEQPQIDWRGMAGFERRLHNFYYRSNGDARREITIKNLPPLKAFAERVLRESED